MDDRFTALVASLDRCPPVVEKVRDHVGVLADFIEEHASGLTIVNGGKVLPLETALRNMKPLVAPGKDDKVMEFLSQRVFYDATVAMVTSPVGPPMSVKELKLAFMSFGRPFTQHLHHETASLIRWLPLGSPAMPSAKIYEVRMQPFAYKHDPREEINLGGHYGTPLDYFYRGFPHNWPSQHEYQEFQIGQCNECRTVFWAWRQWPEVQAQQYRQAVLDAIHKAGVGVVK